MKCPNDCTGNGVCSFIEDVTKDGDDKRNGGATGRTYQLWDQEKIQVCQCDGGYEGYDCSQRVCPMGDDPLTTTGVTMQQLIVVSADAKEFFLTYYDPYGSSWRTGKITSSIDGGTETTACTTIQTELRKLPNHALKAVNVAVASDAGASTFARTAGIDPYTTGSGTSSASADANTKMSCKVTFPDETGTTGLQHLLGCTISAHATAGMNPLSVGDAAATCTVSEYSATSVSTLVLNELATCSNRGQCNHKTGECACYPGHKGAACEEQEALV